MLTWTDIETRAIAFQKRWRDCSGDEKQDGQTFEKDFMEVFGVDWHDGFHEHLIISLEGITNHIDYFLSDILKPGNFWTRIDGQYLSNDQC